MSAGATSDTAFSRATRATLERLAASSGRSNWAMCRDTEQGRHVLAEVGVAEHGDDQSPSIVEPLTCPDGRRFGSLIGFGIAGDSANESADVQLLATLLGAVAGVEMALWFERRVSQLRGNPTDPLTGLATRQGWEQRLRIDEKFCCDFGESGALIVVELDELRQSNELEGHSAGDELLRRAGTVIGDALAGRHYAARITGDRLGIEMIGVDDHEVGELERVIRQGLSSADLSVAIGAARRCADTGFAGAMRTIEEHIDSTHAQSSAAAADTDHIAPLIEALESGAIRAYFQPIVDLRTGEVVTLEALARWQSADGVREPDQFLPQLQQAGLLGALFDRILDHGLEKLVEFRNVSPNLKLAVNFEFDSKPVNSLLDTIRDRLARHDLPPSALSLELSERQTFELPADVQHELFAVAEMGVQLMLDDFGTGFASLETLTTLPVSGVKLDRRFTGQVVNGERESIVVKAMIALAAETGLTVIAEGIETQAQCDRLVRLGCRLGQGYLFALPQPADSLADVLSAPLVSTF